MKQLERLLAPGFCKRLTVTAKHWLKKRALDGGNGDRKSDC